MPVVLTVFCWRYATSNRRRSVFGSRDVSRVARNCFSNDRAPQQPILYDVGKVPRVQRHLTLQELVYCLASRRRGYPTDPPVQPGDASVIRISRPTATTRVVSHHARRTAYRGALYGGWSAGRDNRQGAQQETQLRLGSVVARRSSPTSNGATATKLTPLWANEQYVEFVECNPEYRYPWRRSVGAVRSPESF